MQDTTRQENAKCVCQTATNEFPDPDELWVVDFPDLKSKQVKKIATVELVVHDESGVPDFCDYLRNIQRMFDNERDAKSNLHTYVYKKGLLREYYDWKHGVIPDFECPPLND